MDLVAGFSRLVRSLLGRTASEEGPVEKMPPIVRVPIGVPEEVYTREVGELLQAVRIGNAVHRFGVRLLILLALVGVAVGAGVAWRIEVLRDTIIALH